MSKEAVYQKIEKLLELAEGAEQAAYDKLHAFLDDQIAAATPPAAELPADTIVDEPVQDGKAAVDGASATEASEG